MMKFASALVLGITTATANPNVQMDNGTLRMKAEPIRSEKGGLADVLRNPDFKLDSGNQSYMFMDTSTYF